MFTKSFGSYVCEGDSISCTVDGFDVKATVYRDDCTDTPDQRSDGFWPSHDKAAAGYVLPENFETEMAKAKHAMDTWNKDEWFYCGVALTVARNGVVLTGQYTNAVWGIECNYPNDDNAYLLEVSNDLLSEALEDAKAVLVKLCK